jgi:hypothetical protein
MADQDDVRLDRRRNNRLKTSLIHMRARGGG